MRTTILTLAILLGSLSVSQAADYAIQAKRETVQQAESGLQQRPHGATSFKTADVCYVFTITAMSIATQATAQAEWVILVEGTHGRLHVGTHGSKPVALSAMVRQMEIRTDTVRFDDRDWRGSSGRSSSIGDSIYGYGLRIVDSDGTVLGEKYSPTRMKNKIDWSNRDNSGDSRAPGPTRVGTPNLAPAGEIQTYPARTQRKTSM